MPAQGKKDREPQSTPTGTQADNRDEPVKVGFAVEGESPPKKPGKSSK